VEPVPLTTTNATILVVDDDPQILHFFVSLLSQEGLRVLTAQNGYEALAKIATQHPQLVLLDINMEYLDGFDVLDMIKKHRMDTQVILYSEIYTSDTIVESIKRGAIDFLAKPFPPNSDLLTKIKKYLPSWKKERIDEWD
jgi:DNA-binding NtrC family response regulator